MLSPCPRCGGSNGVGWPVGKALHVSLNFNNGTDASVYTVLVFS
jgi:hypothetical protein